MDGEPSVEEVASALYETDPPESWMRTGTDEYRKRAAAMIDILRRDRTALTEAPPSEPLEGLRDIVREWDAALPLMRGVDTELRDAIERGRTLVDKP